MIKESCRAGYGTRVRVRDMWDLVDVDIFIQYKGKDIEITSENIQDYADLRVFNICVGDEEILMEVRR